MNATYIKSENAPHQSVPPTSANDWSTVILKHTDSLRYSDAWKPLHALYQGDFRADFELHPERLETVLSNTKEWHERPALLIHRVHQNASGQGAVLIPKNVSTKKIPAFGISLPLKGHRLAGNAFIGNNFSHADQAQLLEKALEHLDDLGSEHLLIEDLDVESPLWNVIHDCEKNSWKAFMPQGLQLRHRIDLPLPNRQEYWQKFSSKTRNTFRRNLKKMGDCTFRCFTEPSDVADFLQDAHRISMETWQSKTLGLRIKNDSRELDLFTSAAVLGSFRSYVLYRDDRPVSFMIGLLNYRRYLTSELGYDPQFAKLSPGQVLLVHILEDLIDSQTADIIDFGFGHASYKQIFGTHTSHSADIWMMPSTYKSMGIRCWGTLSRSIVRCAKWGAQRVGAQSSLRASLRKLSLKKTPHSSSKVQNVESTSTLTAMGNKPTTSELHR